jgi:hypothetical protein
MAQGGAIILQGAGALVCSLNPQFHVGALLQPREEAVELVREALAVSVVER